MMVPLQKISQELFQVRQPEHDQLSTFPRPVSLDPSDHDVVGLDDAQLNHRGHCLVKDHHLKKEYSKSYTITN